MGRGVDNDKIGSANFGLFEQGGKLAGLCLNGVQLVLHLAALIPIEGTALRVNVDDGRVVSLPDGAHRHVNGNRGFAASALLGNDCQGFHRPSPDSHIDGYMVIY